MSVRRITSLLLSASLAGVVIVSAPSTASAVVLYTDGSLDTAFSTAIGTGLGGDGTRVLSLAVQPDGRTVAAGTFVTVNGTTSNSVARLNSDGSLDAAFTTAIGTGFDYLATRVALQSDGKILLGGAFTTINDLSAVRLARLNADGSPDAAFNAAVLAGGDHTGFNDYVLAIKQQPDGRILVGGTFTSLNGVARPSLVRLNTDGSVDEAFNTALAGSPGAIVNDIALQPNGNILVGSDSPHALMRLTPAGVVDTAFSDAQGAGFSGDASGEVKSIGQQSDGSIVVGGYFRYFDLGGAQSHAAEHIARLSANGVLDTTFTTTAALDDFVFSLAIQENDAIVVAGDVLKTYATKGLRTVRLAADGAFDTTYATNSGDGPDDRVHTVAVGPDGRAVIGGRMLTVNSVSSRLIARLIGPAINVSSISPTDGPLAGGPVLTVRGSGFTGTPVVTVGGTTCTSPVVVDATTITCTLGAHAAGTVDVMVVNNGVTLHLPGAFTYSATTAVTVASGGAQSCAITTARSIDCWGNNNAGQTEPPAGTFTQESSGYYHGCAVATDASLACWGGGLGGSDFGQVTPPTTGTYSQVSAGVAHSCAVVSDGTVTCWGRNTSGESTAPSGTFTQVSAGGDWNSSAPIGLSCGVHTDRTLACWGDNTDGRATPPSGTYTQVAVGATFACAVSTNHQVVCWGTDSSSVVSTATTAPALEVSAGIGFACARLLGTSVTCWGRNYYGTTSNTPVGSFSSLGTGGNHSCALNVAQGVQCWGWDGRGQLGFGSAPQTFATTSPLTGGTLLSPYSLQLIVNSVVSFHAPTTTFAITSGRLTTGLSLDPSGLISGTPEGTGDYTVDVTSTSVFGTRTATFALTIAPANVTVTANSPTAINPTTAISTISYTTSPTTGPGDWLPAPTCAVFTSADTGFTTPLTGTQPAATYVTHCSGGTSDSYTPTSYVNGSLVIDGTKPTVSVATMPPFASAVSLPVSWTASDNGSGVLNTDVRYRKALWSATMPSATKPASYTPWKSGVTTRTATFTGGQGNQYCFSTRARDAAGNTSGWSTEKCTTLPLDERTLATTGAWTKSAPSGWVAKTALLAKGKGATLRTKTSVKVKQVSLIALKCKACGSVVVQVGATKKTLSLAGPSATGVRTLFTVTLRAKTTGTVSVTITSIGKTVKVDGVVLSAT